MKITNNGYNADTRTVSATFDHEGVTHTRDVNACFDDAGAYDEGATVARLEEVATGVAAKIAAGAIPAVELTDPTAPFAKNAKRGRAAK